MTVEIAWRAATRADRMALQAFNCAAVPVEPRKGLAKVDTKPWETEVQKFIHGLKPPLAQNRTIQMGFLESELTAVVVVVDEPLAPEFFHISLIAVAQSRRESEMHLGDACIEQALYWSAVEGRSRKLDKILISANIHPRNAASRKCFDRNGFTQSDVVGAYQEWLLELQI